MIIRMPLSGLEVSVKIHEHNSPIPINVTIKDGKYKSCYYSSLLMAENNVILQGDESVIIHGEAKLITLEVKNIKTEIAEITGSDAIYIEGVNAIPKGSEREILVKLLSTTNPAI